MFVTAVLFFASGIYLQAVRPIPLSFLFLIILILAACTPLLFAKRQNIALFLIFLMFLCAGMFRIGVSVLAHIPAVIDTEKTLHEGIVIESSPNTKTIRIEKPDALHDVKVLFRTAEAIDINDRVRIVGRTRELSLTFNNPYISSWKWHKKLEGVNYELRGDLISFSRGVNYIEGWRKWLKERIDSSGSRYPAVLKALTIGDTTGISDQLKTLFLRTGTSHILAISGSNIGIVTAFFFFFARVVIRRSPLLRLRGDDTRYAALLSIPFAFMFMVTAGSGIPTIRAAIMITVFMLSLFFERGRHTINTIFFSGLVILLLYPHSLFTASFQLTFISVLAIVISGERLYPAIPIKNSAVKWILSSVLMTVAASIGTLPVVLYHFYGINPFSVIHNLIAIPLMCVVAVPVSLAGLVLPWGEHLLRLAGECIGLAVYLLDRLDMGYIYPIIRPTLPECALYFTFISSIIYIRNRLVSACLACVILPLVVIQGYCFWNDRFNNPHLCVSFIDVGLGDSMLIEAPHGMRMLVDGGGIHGERTSFDVGKSILTPLLLSRKILTLDYVINTHPHGDHAGGLSYVLKTFKVRHFVTGAYFMRETMFIELLRILEEKGLPLELWRRGDSLTFRNGLKIEVMNPDSTDDMENPNDSSLVFRMTYKHTGFLLTGDIGSEVERKMVVGNRPLSSNILKIPHHGSRHSSSFEFVRAVNPDMAVLSVGRGIKGLPGEDALDVYKTLSIPVLRTDINGYIRVCSDGAKLSCKTFR